ncbi:MAG: J domain-containing protein [Candidatus Anstonellales archaeon]
MDINKAMNIFGIKDIGSLKDINSIYRRLMKENHPDLGGNEERAKEINIAYNILKELKDKMHFNTECNQIKDIVILKLDELVMVYEGKDIVKGEKVINKGSLSRYEVYIDIDVDIEIQGVIERVNYIKPYSCIRNYSLSLEVSIPKGYDGVMEVGILNKKLQIVIGNRVRFMLKFNVGVLAFNIELNIKGVDR